MTPMAEPMSESGNSRRISQPSILPERRNAAKLAVAPMTAAHLFVPKARTGEIPVAMRAGIEMRPPPPTIESIKEAMKPKKIRNANISGGRKSIKIDSSRP